jgi:hypothetical protein
VAVVLVALEAKAARAAVLAAMVPFLVPVTNSILGKRPGKQKEQQEYLWTAVSAEGVTRRATTMCDWLLLPIGSSGSREHLRHTHS